MCREHRSFQCAESHGGLTSCIRPVLHGGACFDGFWWFDARGTWYDATMPPDLDLFCTTGRVS